MRPEIYNNHKDEIVVEWIGSDERFGIVFDAVGESSWYYVNKSGTMESGELSEEVLEALKGV